MEASMHVGSAERGTPVGFQRRRLMVKWSSEGREHRRGERGGGGGMHGAGKIHTRVLVALMHTPLLLPLKSILLEKDARSYLSS